MSILVVSGAGTGVGKTVVTAAIATLALARGASVAVVKPAQTGVGPGEPGDLAEIAHLSGCEDGHELARFPDPLAPATAASLRGLPQLDMRSAVATVRELAETRDVVLVEGAGGLLVRFDDRGSTIADLAVALGSPVLLVTSPGLGTLNHTALTLEALAARRLPLAGIVIGSWPAAPDLASRCNIADLEDLAARPLSGALPEGAGALARPDFAATAAVGLDRSLGGQFDAPAFRGLNRPAAPQTAVGRSDDARIRLAT